MNRKMLGAFTVAAVVSGGCLNENLASMRRALPEAKSIHAPAAMLAEGQVAYSADRSQVGAETALQPERQTNDRKLIRNGEMSIEVKSVASALARLGEIVRTIGGQSTSQSEQQNQYGARTASITWLVPAERLDAAVDAVRGLGEPKALSLRTEDVTTGYFDVKVRIDTQKQLERQLVALLQRPSNKLAQLLEIEREVARVRETIDQLEGHIRLWDSQITMSTMAITLTEPAPIAARTGGALATLITSFGAAEENFVLTVAGLVAMSGAALPVVLLLAGPGWLGARAWRRRRAGGVLKTADGV